MNYIDCVFLRVTVHWISFRKVEMLKSNKDIVWISDRLVFSLKQYVTIQFIVWGKTKNYEHCKNIKKQLCNKMLLFYDRHKKTVQ